MASTAFKTYAEENGGRVVLLFLLFLLALYSFYTSGFTAFALVCAIPILVLMIICAFRSQMLTFWVLFGVNYILQWHSSPLPEGIPMSLYNEALELVKNGKVNVDSALTVVRIYGLSGDMNNTFEAMRRLYSDLDSVFSITQNANFDELTTERQLVLSQEEAAINKKLVKRMTNWFIILVLIFLIVYIMGRRRLVRKIWVKNKELKDALEKAEEGSRMKSRIISGIGRELRTPLNVVAGFSQVLSSPDFNPTEKERQDMHQRITENVDKINSAIDRLVELSDENEK
jgi:signal transduction histidine kinase